MIAPDDERARLMRWVICAAIVCRWRQICCWRRVRLPPISTILRGPLTVGPAAFTRWAGFYAGGQFDYSSGNAIFPKQPSR